MSINCGHFAIINLSSKTKLVDNCTLGAMALTTEFDLTSSIHAFTYRLQEGGRDSTERAREALEAHFHKAIETDSEMKDWVEEALMLN